MWELIEIIVRYVHHRKSWLAPVFLVILSVGGVYLTCLSEQKSLEKKETQSQESTQSGFIDQKPVTTAPSNRKQQGKDVLSIQPTASAPKVDSRSSSEARDPIKDDNREEIKNFIQFNDFLREALVEKFGDSFSRNLSHRILENLKNGKTDPAILDQTIAEELGDQSSQAERDHVRQAVTDVLFRIAEEGHK